MSGCSPTIEETRKSFRTDILLLCFVIQYPYQITLCVYRPRKPTACLSPDISGYNFDRCGGLGGRGWALVGPGRLKVELPRRSVFGRSRRLANLPLNAGGRPRRIYLAYQQFCRVNNVA